MKNALLSLRIPKSRSRSIHFSSLLECGPRLCETLGDVVPVDDLPDGLHVISAHILQKFAYKLSIKQLNNQIKLIVQKKYNV